MKFTASALGFALAVVPAFAQALAPGTATNPWGAPLAPREPKVSYDGHQVYRVRSASADHAALHAVERRFGHYHHGHAGRDLDLVVPRDEAASFTETVAALGRDLETRLVSDDLGAQIRAEASRPSTYRRRDLARRQAGDLPDLSWFDTYHDYEDHLDFWDDLQAAFADNSEKVYLGDSYEGREIHAFHLFGDESEVKNEEKPVVLWHGLVHAREWISGKVVEYLTLQLIDGYKTGDANVTRFLDHYDFWIVPFHNPDGFVYTQTADRLWRKNRQPRANTTCVGTDGNRNFEFGWLPEPDPNESANDPCGQTFRGRFPSDTPENQALAALSRDLAARDAGIRSFIDWHSYSQLVLTPWGYSCDPDTFPDTIDRMVDVAEGIADAFVEAGGVEYEAGIGCQVLYFSTGNSRDFHHGELGADHSWTLELRPASADEGGFVLPPEEIWPTVREQWAGQLWLLNEIWDH